MMSYSDMLECLMDEDLPEPVLALAKAIIEVREEKKELLAERKELLEELAAYYA